MKKVVDKIFAVFILLFFAGFALTAFTIIVKVIYLLLKYIWNVI